MAEALSYEEPSMSSQWKAVVLIYRPFSVFSLSIIEFTSI